MGGNSSNRKTSRLWRLALVAVVMLGADLPAEGAQTLDDLFHPDTLHEIRLWINTRDLADLRANYLENRHYPADLQWGDLRLRNVAVRVRGGGSRSATKPGLKVEFNWYTSGQTLLGLNSLVLDNDFQDPALIREQVSMALFNRMGQPAPRESFSRFYINNVYQGVYTIVEDPDDPTFLSRTLGENTGYMFEYKWIMPYHAEYLGDDVVAYKPLFEPRTHRLDPDSILYSPIRDLFREVNQAEDTMWRQQVGRHIDLAQFVTQAAIETFLSDLDGLLGYAGMNNFYLYRYAGQSVHRVFPWDKDVTFQQADSSIFLRADENVLFGRAMAFDDLRSLYLDVLEQTARLAAQDNWLLGQIEHSSSLIGDAAHEDIWKSTSNDDYDQATEFLKNFARRRSSFVLQEIAKVRGTP